MAQGYHKTKKGTMAKKGLWYNIQQKKKRIAAGSGEKMRKPGTKGAPTAKAIKKPQGKNNATYKKRCQDNESDEKRVRFKKR